MLWFGLRRRLGNVTRRLRRLEEQLDAHVKRLDALERTRATLAETLAAAENATDKLNRVVERRRKQLAEQADEVCAHGISMEEECEDCAYEELLEQRQLQLNLARGGTDGRGTEAARQDVPGVSP